MPCPDVLRQPDMEDILGGRKTLPAMSLKEKARETIINCWVDGEMCCRQAAEQMGVSRRHAWRLRARWEQQGTAGLISRRRGQPSNRRYPADLHQRVLDLLRGEYEGIAPAEASELLLQRHGIRLSRETVRLWMIQAGLWCQRKRTPDRVHPLHPKRPRCDKLVQMDACADHQRRFEREHFLHSRRLRCGELVHMDACTHLWFGDWHQPCVLLVFIDDATSQLLHLEMAEAETTQAYFRALESYLQIYGRPLSIHTGRNSIFSTTAAERLRGHENTQMQRALNALDINLAASCPHQARGRVMRVHRTLKNRLLNWLRLEDITDVNAANKRLNEYRRWHNQQYSVPASDPEKAHRPVNCKPRQMKCILSHREMRPVSQGSTISYRNNQYLLKFRRGRSCGLSQHRATVCERHNGEIIILDDQGSELRWRRVLHGTVQRASWTTGMINTTMAMMAMMAMMNRIVLRRRSQLPNVPNADTKADTKLRCLLHGTSRKVNSWLMWPRSTTSGK